MKAYIIPFIFYLLSAPILERLSFDPSTSYALKTAIVATILVFFWKEYKVKIKLDWLTIIIGVLVFVLWIVLEGRYPVLGATHFVPTEIHSLVIKLVGFLIVAPVIEEIFIRDFFHRYIIKKDWKKVKVGQFSWLAFIVTVLVFGLSHNRWLSGMIAGALYNVLLYRSKSIGKCISAHFITNLLLSAYILYTKSYWMW